VTYKFKFDIPDDYPHTPPDVHCYTKIYHPNINLEGKVCLNILREDWRPVLDISAVIYGLIFLFYEPKPDDLLNHEAAELSRKDTKNFERLAQQTLREGVMDGVSVPQSERGHDEHGITRQASSNYKIAPNVAAVPPLDTSSTSSIKNKTTKSRRKPREIDKSYSVEPKDDDVLYGKGGGIYKHPGNIKFRNKALELRSWYEQSDNEEKTAISKVLLKSVTDNGNRFLEKGDDGLWHVVNEEGARYKASQALREKRRR